MDNRCQYLCSSNTVLKRKNSKRNIASGTRTQPTPIHHSTHYQLEIRLSFKWMRQCEKDYSIFVKKEKKKINNNIKLKTRSGIMKNISDFFLHLINRQNAESGLIHFPTVNNRESLFSFFFFFFYKLNQIIFTKSVTFLIKRHSHKFVAQFPMFK